MQVTDDVLVMDDSSIHQNREISCDTAAGEEQALQPPHSPTKGLKHHRYKEERAARKNSFLARVMAQQTEQDAFRAKRTKQQEATEAARRNSSKQKKKLSTNMAPTPTPATTTPAPSSRPSEASVKRAPGTFSVYSPRLKLAPDGLHYIEDNGNNVVDTTEKSSEPLCVMLIQRRRYPATRDHATATAEGDAPEMKEEVVVRYLPMADLLTAIRKAQRCHRHGNPIPENLKGLYRAHGGREGLTSMHLEVAEDFSFLPEVFKADEIKSDDSAQDTPKEAANEDERAASIVAKKKQTEPSVYDFFIPPSFRNVELRAQKHKSGLSYIKHKMRYTKKDLEDMGRRDRRSYLACERRFLFMRQLQRDFDCRLENEKRLRRYQDRQLRLLGRIQRHQQGGSGGANGDLATAATMNALYTSDGNGNVGYHGNNLYVRGREIPEELVQTFFSLNDEYEAFQRSMERRRQRELRERQKKANGESQENDGNGHHQTRSERPPDPAGGEVDIAASMMRWGDALLFPGQRPVDGFVVVTAGPSGMRGWRRVLTGQRPLPKRKRGAGAAVPSRHIDLYAMAQRSAFDPNTNNGMGDSVTTTTTTDNNNSSSNTDPTARPSESVANPPRGNSRRQEDEDDDEEAYTRHFRYQLFYADESDMDSDDDMLCGEARQCERRVTASGPVHYGHGYYINTSS